MAPEHGAQDGAERRQNGERGERGRYSRLRSHPALIAIVRLLARQAAQDALIASRVEQEIQYDAEED